MIETQPQYGIRHEHLIEQLEAKLDRLDRLVTGIICGNSRKEDEATERFERLENEVQLNAAQCDKDHKFRELLDRHDVPHSDYLVT